MATALKYPTSTNAVQKTLDAALLAGATASVTLNSVTGIQNLAGVFVVDRVDANGTATPSKREYITFTGVSGSTLTGLTRNADGGGTDQDHAVGAIVEFVSDILQEQAIIDGLLQTLNTDGTIKTGIALPSPVLTTPQINDTSSDHQYVVAVSELAADRTVTLPLLTGADEFVFKDHTQTLTNKTLTSPLFQGSVDGWISANETWTYASASTITVPAGATLKYSRGDKIAWVQDATQKYGVIKTVANTLLTIITNTDYVVANSEISSVFYSHATTPVGFPTHFAYTPTGPTNTTLTGRYNTVGTHIWVTIKGAVTGTPSFASMPTLPVAVVNNAHFDRFSFLGGYADTGTAGRWGRIFGVITTTGTTVALYNGEATAGDSPLVSATVPITWANTDMWNVEVDYEF